MKHLTYALVRWEDATEIEDYDTDGNPITTCTAGFLLKVTPKKVVIASEVFENGEVRRSIVIPRGMIRRIYRLGRVSLPK